jgi:hypothetical protein
VSWTHERGRVAALTRSREPDDPELVEARRNMRAERLAVYIQKCVEQSPPLSEAQIDRLTALFRPTPDDRGTA